MENTRMYRQRLIKGIDKIISALFGIWVKNGEKEEAGKLPTFYLDIFQ